MGEGRLQEAQSQLSSGARPLVGIGFWDPEKSLPGVALDTILDGIRRAAEKQFAPTVRSPDNEQLRGD